MLILLDIIFADQLDIGGGGGTTWSGTLRKLAMPGVLFHHVTPTKDFFHDELVPLEHYIPVELDLSDLRERYEWAEAHPRKARRIADAGRDFVARMRSDAWLERTYKRYFDAELGAIVDAYRAAEDETFEASIENYGTLSLSMTCNRKGCTSHNGDNPLIQGRHQLFGDMLWKDYV